VEKVIHARWMKDSPRSRPEEMPRVSWGERTLEIARPTDRILTDIATGKALGFLGQVIQRNFYGNGVADSPTFAQTLCPS
jgi:hypothetical protein